MRADSLLGGALGTNTFEGLRKAGLSKWGIKLLSFAKRLPLVGPMGGSGAGGLHSGGKEAGPLLPSPLPLDRLLDAAASREQLGPWVRQLSLRAVPEEGLGYLLPTRKASGCGGHGLSPSAFL